MVLEIDGALEEELKDSLKYSVVDAANIIDKYAEEWKERADEYYNKLMEFDGILQLNDHYYSSDDFHTFISEMKTNWEQYYQVESENYLKMLEAVNTGSSNTVTMMARYEYEMQKEWALKLINIYLMIDQ